MKNQVDLLVDNLGCSQAEALEIIEYDKQVDKMTVAQCESDLSAEQKAMAKKYRQGERKQPMVLNLPKKRTQSRHHKRRYDKTIIRIFSRVWL